MNTILQDGILVGNKKISVSIHSFVCDAPARAYLKGIKGHSGYSSCERCTEVGEYVKGRVIFENISAVKRTDETFLLKLDPEHHLIDSPLLDVKQLGLVSDFPIDYMHNVCLGIMRKLMNLWFCISSPVKLDSHSSHLISSHLIQFQNYIPKEINRKPRSLQELQRWKATEFRSFLVYFGPIVLKRILDISIYEHFLLFHVGISILLSTFYLANYGASLADSYLKAFVKHSSKIYGKHFLIHNVYMLSHLSDDVKKYGVLDEFSAFPFENFLGKLKHLVKSPHRPLQQICNRISEIQQFNSSSHSVNISKDVYPEMEHHLGPLPTSPDLDLKFSEQFKKIHFNNFVLIVHFHSSADSYCFIKNGKVIQIHNILLHRGHLLIVGKQFKFYEPLYIYI